MQKRFLIFGANPDDPDIMFGGTALKLIKAVHAVKFVSVTNGCAGHHILSEKELILRCYQEAQASAEILGLEKYQIMNKYKTHYSRSEQKVFLLPRVNNLQSAG